MVLYFSQNQEKEDYFMILQVFQYKHKAYNRHARLWSFSFCHLWANSTCQK